MDRNWIKTSKIGDQDYENGVAEFFRFVEMNVKNLNKVACPCCNCGNMYFFRFDVVKIHLRKKKFDRNYTCWFFHGEPKHLIKPTLKSREDEGSSRGLGVDFMDDEDDFLRGENENENEIDNENENEIGNETMSHGENELDNQCDFVDGNNDVEDDLDEPELENFVEKLLREEEQPCILVVKNTQG